MTCWHCDRRISTNEREDSAFVGARHPLCTDCTDMVVLDMACPDCGKYPDVERCDEWFVARPQQRVSA